ncbi:MAG: hypothetical protein WCK84_10585 [Bacteroidota bacterium]
MLQQIISRIFNFTLAEFHHSKKRIAPPGVAAGGFDHRVEVGFVEAIAVSLSGEIIGKKAFLTSIDFFTHSKYTEYFTFC